MVIFSSLTKSGFCCMRRRVPSPWASAVWHGGPPSCFPGFVRNALLAGHVLANCSESPSGSRVSISASQWPNLPSNREVGRAPARTYQRMLAVVPPQLANLRQEVSCVGEGLKCLKVWNVCSYLECCLHSWHWAPSGEIGPLSFLPFLLSFPKATRGQKETSLPFPFFFFFFLLIIHGKVNFFSGPRGPVFLI